MQCDEIIGELRMLSNPEAAAGMGRFGIEVENTLGISIPVLRRIARRVGRDHDLAGDLWRSGVHEARILASMVDDPGLVSEARMEEWVGSFGSWDVCDQCCNNLFSRTAYAWQKAVEWSGRREEFVKRAGFVLMANLAVHDKKAADERFEGFFPIIAAESGDERNFVKKAVNWALRQIGKRNRALNLKAVEAAESMATASAGSKAARWIAADALRELTSPEVRGRLGF